MSDEWNFYPLTIDENPASIFYDHGVGDEVESLPEHLLRISVRMRMPRPDGLSSSEEYDALNALENDLTELVSQHQGVYMGRLTTNGYRRFYIATLYSDEAWQDWVSELGPKHQYEIQFHHRPGDSRSFYRENLFPSEDDWQVILDMRILEALEEANDDGTIPRHIDHWAYFATRESADLFSSWATANGYNVEQVEPQEKEFCVKFNHEDAVTLQRITSHTLPLRRKACELGGNYDGWETIVCSSSNN